MGKVHKNAQNIHKLQIKRKSNKVSTNEVGYLLYIAPLRYSAIYHTFPC